MTTTDLVRIDTCIWVPFFNRPQSAQKLAVDSLLDEDRAAILGPILAEILQAFRHQDRAVWVASMLRGLLYLYLEWDDWRATLGRQLASLGYRLPLSDLAIAAVAFKADAAVFTPDPHFDLIPDLKRNIPN